MKNQQGHAIGIYNVLIIIYNFISVLVNRINGFVSYISIGILAFNLFITIYSLKNNGKTTSEVICLIIEIVTAIIILFSIS